MRISTFKTKEVGTAYHLSFRSRFESLKQFKTIQKKGIRAIKFYCILKTIELGAKKIQKSKQYFNCVFDCEEYARINFEIDYDPKVFSDYGATQELTKCYGITLEKDLISDEDVYSSPPVKQMTLFKKRLGRSYTYYIHLHLNSRSKPTVEKKAVLLFENGDKVEFLCKEMEVSSKNRRSKYSAMIELTQEEMKKISHFEITHFSLCGIQKKVIEIEKQQYIKYAQCLIEKY